MMHNSCFIDSCGIIIEEVDATMRLEGMPLPSESKETLRRCLKGETTFEMERQRIFNEIKEYHL